MSTGQASHPFIGVQLRSLTPQLAREINATSTNCTVPEVNGVLVVDVVPDTPAAEADVRQCDLISAVDNTKVSNPSEVQLAVDRGTVGEPMKLTVERNGMTKVLNVRPQELPRNR